MTDNRTYLLTLVGATLLATPSWAETPKTLKAAVEQAVLQNPEVKVRYYNLESAGEEQRAAKGAWLPRVDIEAKAARAQRETPLLGSIPSYSNPSTLVQLRQTLFDGFATSSEVRRLGFNRQARYYELLAITDETALEAARAYIDVLRYRDLTELAKTNYATHAEIHAQLASRVKAGVGRRVDLEQAAGRLALAESNWLTESSNLHDVTARYQRLIGEMPAATLAPLPSLDSYLPNRDGFLAKTISTNASFLASVAAIRASRADADVRRANRYPTLELRANESYERNQSGLRGDYRDKAVQLVLNYNLYRGGADNARIRQYEAQLNAAYELRNKSCRDIRQTAQIAYNDVRRLGSQLSLLEQHELSTAKARDAYRQQFDIGQRSLLDLLDTENELFEARRALSNGEFDLQLAKVRVLTYSSRLLGALQLRPIETDSPEPTSGTAEDDSLLTCGTELPADTTLDKDNLPKLNLTPPPVPERAAAAPVPTPASECAKLPNMLVGWNASWNRKDLKAYLGYYSKDFVPALGMTRKAWEELRKRRIDNKQGNIKVQISDIKAPKCEADHAEIAFSQQYGSDDYKDSVEKTLNFVFTNGEWKIVQETVTKGRTF